MTADLDDPNAATIFIITVPTPIDVHNRPDLTPLFKASETAGRALKKGDIVIYESTVYPGATEENCVPLLECVSGLTYNVDFFCGCSHKRINSGDNAHRLPKIRKVTSGSTPEIADKVDVHGPWADVEEARHEYGLHLIGTLESGAYDGIVLAVAHDKFRN